MTKATKKRPWMGTSKAAAQARRVKFAVAYLANDQNGTQAAIAAGFAPAGAHVAASRLLKDAKVLAEIEEGRKRLSLLVDLDPARTLQEVARIAYFDPRRAFHDDGTPKHVLEMDDDTAAAVAGVETLQEKYG